MAKSKKKKIKRKKSARKTTGKRAKPKKKSTAKTKPAKVKKATRKAASKQRKPDNLPEKESKKNAKQQKESKQSIAQLEIVSKPVEAVSAEHAPKPPSPRAIARAKAALAAKEKAKIPALPIDKAAAEKQLKLPEPRNKLELEYIIHASPALLYEFITTPSGLSEWFADNVNIQGSMYSFFWEGAEQKARVLSARENKSIRFQWVDRPPASYFELRIEKNELTEELSLLITDFAENPDEMSSLEVLWQGQVQRLMKVIGSKI